MKNYLKRLYESRYFWIHLSKMELKNKFRRSKLGILWTFISPLCLTAIMAVVFATVFHSDILTYAPYILSGIIFWDLFSGSLIGGSFVIIANDAYIRQFNHPITIYTLKSAIVYTISFLIAMLSLVIWMVFVEPKNLILGIVTLPITAILFFLLSWSCITIAAFTNTKYRDYPQMMPLIIQIFWYLSPVFFQEEMFESNKILYMWFNLNPLTHVLFLIRKPFLYGEMPTMNNYFITIIFIAIFGFIAIIINKRNAKNIVFYI